MGGNAHRVSKDQPVQLKTKIPKTLEPLCVSGKRGIVVAHDISASPVKVLFPRGHNWAPIPDPGFPHTQNSVVALIGNVSLAMICNAAIALNCPAAVAMFCHTTEAMRLVAFAANSFMFFFLQNEMTVLLLDASVPVLDDSVPCFLIKQNCAACSVRGQREQ